MAGLDKILDDIRAEGAKAVESVKSAAQAAYDAEMEKARQEADTQAQKILSSSVRSVPIRLQAGQA